MKWITREKAKVDRIACPWLISRFVDKDAEFIFVSKDRVMEAAREKNAIPFDVEGADLTHYKDHGEERVSFDSIIKKYGLKDSALLDFAEIVRGADASLPNPRRESAGLEAAALGFREIAGDDHENMKLQFPLYDALYQYCKLLAEKKTKLEHSAH
ncbi:MAG: chromate resistance protein [Thermoplasmatales archaeon B_DKE]|nr:MAG: chromate resistance protein [Thermoplasmatales archaeon B_DKE]